MSAATRKLVLASRSPRRARILTTLGLAHDVEPASVDESVLAGEDPSEHVERLARSKAEEVAGRHPDALVLGGDTVVVRDDEILGKPRDEADAVRMLLSLAGREHTVRTGLALAVPDSGGRVVSRVDETTVRFRAFGESDARGYVATGEPMDKAGAYGIQGVGAVLVERIEGDYHTVVGLPVSGLVALLDEAGHPFTFRTQRP